MQAWYTTRNAVLNSFEIAETSRINAIVDNEIIAASEGVDSLLHRKLTVENVALKFDWPNYQYAPPNTLYLGDRTMLEVTDLISGGITLDPSKYILRRADGEQIPPYEYIELNAATSAEFTSGSTSQQAIIVRGLAGYDSTTALAATLTANIDDSTEVIGLSPIANLLNVDVGSALIIDTERFHVVERSYTSAGTTLLGDLVAKKSDSVIEVGTNSNIARYQHILIDGEFMLVTGISDSYITVQRASNGSVLSSHDKGCVVYVPNSFTVMRGAFGTTSAEHTASTSVYVQRYPALVTRLATAEAIVGVSQNAGQYARVVGSGAARREGTGAGLDDMREKAYWAFGRTLRKTAI